MESPKEPVDACQAEKAAYKQAMHECQRLQQRAGPDATPKPREFGEDAQPVPSMNADFDALDAAERVCKERRRAYRACVRAHRPGGPPGSRARTGS